MSNKFGVLDKKIKFYGNFFKSYTRRFTLNQKIVEISMFLNVETKKQKKKVIKSFTKNVIAIRGPSQK